ncbi:hypothetical protein KCU62_g252, partial [Aureobasidium sp. EXF-3399]
MSRSLTYPLDPLIAFKINIHYMLAPPHLRIAWKAPIGRTFMPVGSTGSGIIDVAPWSRCSNWRADVLSSRAQARMRCSAFRALETGVHFRLAACDLQDQWCNIRQRQRNQGLSMQSAGIDEPSTIAGHIYHRHAVVLLI